MTTAISAVVFAAAVALTVTGLAVLPRRLSVAVSAARSKPAAEAEVIAQALAEVRR